MALPLHQLPGSSSLSGLAFFNGANPVMSRKVNLAGSGPPTVLNDASAGYGIGSRWMDLINSIEYICFDATPGAAVWIAAGNSANTSKQTIAFTNSFTVGQPIRKSAANFVLSKGDSVGDAETLGTVESSTGAAMTVVYSGKLNWPSHGFALDAVLFLSPTTAGALTTTEPSAVGQVVKLVGYVLDANTIVVVQGRGKYLDGGVAQATETTSGIAEIATQAETDAGTDDLRFMTPLKFASNPRLPSQAENDALLGTSGVASGTNRYVTNSDSRLSDSRTPLSHQGTHLPAGSDALPWTSIIGRGLAASRPTASSANAGYIYMSSDTPALERSNGTTWDSIDPAKHVPLIVLQHQATAGTAGGTFTQGAWQTRPITTEVIDTDNLCTIASNQFTLLAGNYFLRATGVAFNVNRCQTRIRNITDSTSPILGEVLRAASNSVPCPISGYITIAATKTFEFQHWCETTSSSTGFGEAFSVGTEVYATIILEKINNL